MQKIGRYEVLEELGHGAMGVVYRARDPQIGRIVAIKVIKTENVSAAETVRYKLRFQREAQAVGRMSHPGIVTIHDIAEDDNGQPYLVLEYVEGTPLDRLIVPPAVGLPFARALELGVQIAQALDYAHHNGVVHRDIKPANILITNEGRAKIADFGIAKMAGADLTQVGHSVGTPSFMSPEQFLGGAVDARSDMFSFGSVLYWMTTGQKPFQGASVSVVTFKIAYEEPPPARGINADLPAEFETVLSRCLAKNPDHRYNSCAEVAADLEALRAGARITTQPAPDSTFEKTVHYPPLQAVASGHASPSEDETTRVMRVQSTGKAKMGGTRKWSGVAIGALILTTILLGSGYWLGMRRPAERGAAGQQGVLVAPATATTAAPAAGSSIPKATTAATPVPLQPAVKAPVIKNVEKKVEKTTAPAAMLVVSCAHNFKSANLEIFSDGKQLLQIPLTGKRRGLGVGYKGELQIAKPIPAGEHTLRVHVSTPDEKFDGTEEISGTFAVDGTRTLAIEFGKGSALGMVPRKLTLSWR